MLKTLGSSKPLAAAFVLLTGFAGAATAAPILIFGDGTTGSTENLGSFTGSLTYLATNETTATLTISLTNTSPAANGGFLTAFAFNNPDELISGVSLSATDGDFTNLLGGPNFDDNDVDANPHGDFDIGASSSSTYLGGDAPSGLGVGDSGTFTFSLTGLDLDTLTEQSFVNELSFPTDENDPEFFVARFRGFEDGGSDKVPAGVVPVPAAAWLLGSALVGLAGWARRRS